MILITVASNRLSGYSDWYEEEQSSQGMTSDSLLVLTFTAVLSSSIVPSDDSPLLGADLEGNGEILSPRLAPWSFSFPGECLKEASLSPNNEYRQLISDL